VATVYWWVRVKIFNLGQVNFLLLRLGWVIHLWFGSEFEKIPNWVGSKSTWVGLLFTVGQKYAWVESGHGPSLLQLDKSPGFSSSNFSFSFPSISIALKKSRWLNFFSYNKARGSINEYQSQSWSIFKGGFRFLYLWHFQTIPEISWSQLTCYMYK